MLMMYVRSSLLLSFFLLLLLLLSFLLEFPPLSLLDHLNCRFRCLRCLACLFCRDGCSGHRLDLFGKLDGCRVRAHCCTPSLGPISASRTWRRLRHNLGGLAWLRRLRLSSDGRLFDRTWYPSSRGDAAKRAGFWAHHRHPLPSACGPEWAFGVTILVVAPRLEPLLTRTAGIDAVIVANIVVVLALRRVSWARRGGGGVRVCWLWWEGFCGCWRYHRHFRNSGRHGIGDLVDHECALELWR